MNRKPLWLLCAPALLASLIHFASYDIHRQPIATDIALYLYFSGQTADGAVPYRDFFEYKTPLSVFAGAALHRLGTTFGIDPLLAIRTGYLFLLALTTTSIFALFLCLFDNRPAAGWIALLLLFGFSFLGMMPATGNIPKLLAMLFAFTALYSLHRRRWLSAGLFACLSGMDWQIIGFITFVALLCSVSLHGTDRKRAFTRIVFGSVICVTPFLVYFSFHGVLDEFFRMTIGASFSNTNTPLTDCGFSGRWHNHIVRNVRNDCAGEEWILLLGFAGIALAVPLFYWARARANSLLACGLMVYQYGILLFSLLDFQAHGDVFPLLVTLGIFAALPLVLLVKLILSLLRKVPAGSLGRFPHRRIAAVLPWLIVALLVLLVKPSFLGGGLRLNQPRLYRNVYTLPDQREVADRFFREAGTRTVLFLHRWELLFLENRTNPLPFTVWNSGTHHYYMDGHEKDAFAALVERLDRLSPDIVVPWARDLRHSYGKPLAVWLDTFYNPRSIHSSDGSYSVDYWIRSE